MILQGKYGKGLSIWMRDNAVAVELRGEAGKNNWQDTFSLEEAQWLFLTAALAIAEQMRLRDLARQHAAAAVSAPGGTQP